MIETSSSGVEDEDTRATESEGKSERSYLWMSVFAVFYHTDMAMTIRANRFASFVLQIVRLTNLLCLFFCGVSPFCWTRAALWNRSG